MISNVTFIILRFDGHLGKPGFIRQANPFFDRRAGCANTVDDGRKCCVEHDEFIFSMIDHPDNLLRLKAWIDRMDNRANGTDGIIDFDMAIIIPSNGRDAVAFTHTGRFQRIG